MGLHVDDPIVVSLGSMALGILGKWFWDRFLAKPSRVTAEMCSKTREVCLAQLKMDFQKQGSRLEEGDKCFDDLDKDVKKIRSYLYVLLNTNLRLCAKMNVDCDEINRLLAEHGIIE
jgi:hypothetical protein